MRARDSTDIIAGDADGESSTNGFNSPFGSVLIEVDVSANAWTSITKRRDRCV